MNKNILLIGSFGEAYLNFLIKKYSNHKIHYWHRLEEKSRVVNINYCQFENFNDEILFNFVEKFEIHYDLVLVSLLDYWDNIRVIRNIPKNLSKNGILIINDVIHTKEYYSQEISLYGHNLLYDSIEFIKKAKLLFSNLAPYINNMFSSNEPSSIILLIRK